MQCFQLQRREKLCKFSVTLQLQFCKTINYAVIRHQSTSSLSANTFTSSRQKVVTFLSNWLFHVTIIGFLVIREKNEIKFKWLYKSSQTKIPQRLQIRNSVQKNKIQIDLFILQNCEWNLNFPSISVCTNNGEF